MKVLTRAGSHNHRSNLYDKAVQEGMAHIMQTHNGIVELEMPEMLYKLIDENCAMRDTLSELQTDLQQRHALTHGRAAG